MLKSSWQLGVASNVSTQLMILMIANSFATLCRLLLLSSKVPRGKWFVDIVHHVANCSCHWRNCCGRKSCRLILIDRPRRPRATGPIRGCCWIAFHRLPLTRARGRRDLATIACRARAAGMDERAVSPEITQALLLHTSRTNQCLVICLNLSQCRRPSLMSIARLDL